MPGFRGMLCFAAMTLVTLVVAHNAVFVLAYGPGDDEALAHSGHDGAWGTAVLFVVISALVLLTMAALRLGHLAWVARSLGARDTGRGPNPGAVARGLAVLWLRVAGVATLLFIVQENLEHLRAGERLPGLSVLGSASYPDAILVIAAVALAVAGVAALFRWQRASLLARINGARPFHRPPPRLLKRRRTGWIELRHASIAVHQFPGRAPPQLSAR